jgi:hypothetical protein
MIMRFGTVKLQETLLGKYCLSTYPKFTCTSKPNSINVLNTALYSRNCGLP